MKRACLWMVAVGATLGLSRAIALAAGGEACGDAAFVPSIPYSNTGDTCLFADDYDEVCLGSSQSGDTVGRQAQLHRHCGGQFLHAESVLGGLPVTLLQQVEKGGHCRRPAGTFLERSGDQPSPPSLDRGPEVLVTEIRVHGYVLPRPAAIGIEDGYLDSGNFWLVLQVEAESSDGTMTAPPSRR